MKSFWVPPLTLFPRSLFQEEFMSRNTLRKEYREQEVVRQSFIGAEELKRNNGTEFKRWSEIESDHPMRSLRMDHTLAPPSSYSLTQFDVQRGMQTNCSRECGGQ